jgi:hypothetical protein
VRFVRIEDEIGRRLLFAFDQVEIDELDRRLQVSGNGAGCGDSTSE